MINNFSLPKYSTVHSTYVGGFFGRMKEEKVIFVVMLQKISIVVIPKLIAALAVTSQYLEMKIIIFGPFTKFSRYNKKRHTFPVYSIFHSTCYVPFTVLSYAVQYVNVHFLIGKRCLWCVRFLTRTVKETGGERVIVLFSSSFLLPPWVGCHKQHKSYEANQPDLLLRGEGGGYQKRDVCTSCVCTSLGEEVKNRERKGQTMFLGLLFRQDKV